MFFEKVDIPNKIFSFFLSFKIFAFDGFDVSDLANC